MKGSCRVWLARCASIIAPTNAHSPVPRSRAVRDLVVAIFLGLVVGSAVVLLDTSERFLEFASHYEDLQLDELPLLLLTSSVLLAWLAGRRWTDAEMALRAHIQAEQRVRELLQENQRLLSHALEAQEEERGNLARELHDDLGQYLHAARAEAVALRFSLHDQEQQARVMTIETSLTHIAKATREQIGRLRPPALDALGLVAAIEYLLERQCAAAPELDWQSTLTPALDKLPAAVGIQVYRIVQECLTNTVRHAHATMVTVVSSPENRGLMLQIRDNGHGFPGVFKSGFGLPGMRERAESFGGELLIDGTSGQGVCVTLHIPVVRESLS